MAAYTRGNLAVEEQNRSQRKVKVRETHKVVYRSRSLPAREKLFCLAAVLLIAFVGGIVISKYALIYQVNKEMYDTKVKIQAVQEDTATKKNMLATFRNPDNLKKLANQLGLHTLDPEVMESSKGTSSQAKGEGAAKR